jgi:inner membrane protein
VRVVGMLKQGHVGGALIFFFIIIIPASFILNISKGSVFLGMALAMIVAPLLDYDILISDEFHRSFYTHSLLTVVVLTFACLIITLFICPYTWIFTLAVFSASLSHVLLDSLTIMGVPLYGPWNKNMVGLKIFKSNDGMINYILIVIGVIFAAIYFL